MTSRKLRLPIALLVIAATVGLLASAALAVSPAAFTTDSTGSAVNKNHYVSKCDVYLNGGPTGAALPAGSYVFGVLAPSGQADPNGSNLLSTDSNANRTFSSDGSSVTYGGTHTTSTDSVTGKTLIDLCDYADTPNPGGVYIAFICQADNMTPSGCKYDAFKVKGLNPPPGGDDLVGTKSASGSFTRTFGWTTAKSCLPVYIQSSGSTVTANCTVTVTKSAGVDSGWTVTGQVMVFNPNDDPVTGVSVSDVIGTTSCTVTGGSTSIAGGSSATFDYTCSVADASSGTNTATITWDKTSINSPDNSTTATAGFSFGDPTLVGNCTTVSDTVAGLLGTVCATHTFSYSETLNVPASGCTDYPNTASETTSGTSASASVRVCRTNSNGFTMGYWQNKNGQAQIGTAYAGLCTYLAQYGNVLSLPSPCTSTSLKNYVYNVIKAANAAGDGAPMFKGQFLATALSAYFNAALAGTGVVVPTSISSTGCITVAGLLTYGNTNYATLSLNKTTFMMVKSIYDSINNNNQLTC